MTHAYGYIELVNPLGAVNGDPVNGVSTTVAIAPDLFGGYAVPRTNMRITQARSYSIVTTATSYEMRLKHPCNYNGSEDCSYWGVWFTIDQSIHMHNGIGFIDMEFRNATGTFKIYINA